MAIIERISLEGGDDVAAQLDQIGASGQQALQKLQGAGADGAAGVQALKDGFAPLQEGFAGAGAGAVQFGAALQTSNGSATSFGQTMTTLAESFAGIIAVGAAAAAAIFGIGNSASAAAAKIGDAADAAGVSVKAWQELAFAARQVGTEESSLSAFFAKFDAESVKSQTEAEALGTAFDKATHGLIGGTAAFQAEVAKNDAALAKLSAQFPLLGTSGQSAEDALLKLADRIKNAGSEAQQTALAMQLLTPKLGRDLLPFLQEGSAGLKVYFDQFHSLGQELTAGQIEIARSEQLSIDNLKSAISAARTQTGLLFAPIITAGADWLTEKLVAWHKSISDFTNGSIKQAIATIQDLISILSGEEAGSSGTWIDDWAEAFQGLAVIISGSVIAAFRGLGEIIDGIGRAFNNAFGTDITGRVLVITVAVAGLLSSFGPLGAVIGIAGSAFALFGSRISAILPIINDFVAALSGNTAAVTRPWILAWVQAVENFGASIKTAITGIALPAFEALVNSAKNLVTPAFAALGQMADSIAQSINGVFGSNVTGQSAGLAASIFTLSSGFGLFGTAVSAAAALFALFGADLANAEPVIQEFIAALTGDTAAVTRPWILEWMRALEDFASSAKQAIVDIVVPAFHSLEGIAQSAATAINNAFGSHLTGSIVLLGGALFLLLGGFGLFRSLISEAGTALFDFSLVGAVAGRSFAALGAFFGVVFLALRDLSPALKLGAKDLEEHRGAAVALGDVTKTLGGTFSALGTVISSVIVPALLFISHTADSAAASLNGIFGTKLTGDALLISAALLNMVGVFGIVGGAARVFTGIWQALVFVLGGGLVRNIVSIGAGLLSLAGFLGTVAVGATAAAGVVVFSFARMTAAAIIFAASTLGVGVAPFLAILAGAGIVASAVFLFWDTIKAAWNEGLDFIKQKTNAVIDEIKAIFGKASAAIKELFGFGSAQAAESPLKQTAADTAKDADKIKETSSDVTKTFHADWENLKDKVFSLSGSIKDSLTGNFKSVKDGSIGSITEISKELESLKDSSSDTGKVISDNLTGHPILAWFSGGLGGILDFFKSISGASAKTAQDVTADAEKSGQAIVHVYRGTKESTVGVFKESADGAEAALEDIPAAAEKSATATVNVFRGTKETISTVYKEGSEAVVESLGNIGNAAKIASGQTSAFSEEQAKSLGVLKPALAASEEAFARAGMRLRPVSRSRRASAEVLRPKSPAHGQKLQKRPIRHSMPWSRQQRKRAPLAWMPQREPRKGWPIRSRSRSLRRLHRHHWPKRPRKWLTTRPELPELPSKPLKPLLPPSMRPRTV